MMEGPRHQHLHQEWQEPLEEPTDPENKSTKAKQHVAQVHAPRETERQLNFFLLPFGRDRHTMAGCACLLTAFPPNTHHTLSTKLAIEAPAGP